MRIRHLLAALIILAAAAIRFIGLGWPELSPDEAGPAVAASAGTPVASPYPVEDEGAALLSPAYASLSRPLMVAFGAETWSARAVPALAGLMLVLAPLFLASKMGWPLALSAMTLLAVSPSLVTLSRTAGGDSLALLGVAGATVALIIPEREGRWTAVGAFAALALACGAPVWTGLVGLGVAAAVTLALGLGLKFGSVDDGRWRSGLGAGAVAFAALTTAFFSDVSLLAGALAGPGQWLAGWSPFALEPSLRTSPLLLLVEALVLGLAIALVLARRRSLTMWHRALAIWAGAALVLFIIYPGRSPAGLAWAVLPAVPLAAQALLEAIRLAGERTDRAIVWLLAIGASAVLFFGLFLLQRFGPTWLGVDPVQRLGLLVSFIGVSVGGTLMVWWGWGTRTVVRGLALAALALLVLWDIGMTSSFNFSGSAARALGLWRRMTTPESAALMVDTIEDISQASIGRRQGLTVDVRGPRSAQVAWLLREFKPPEPAVGLAQSPPVILIQAGQPLPATADEYIGQDLVLVERRGYTSGLRDSLRAVTGRPAPSIPSLWTIFVRSDLAGLPQDETGESLAP